MLDARIDEAHSGWLYNRLLFDCELLTTTVMMRASLIKAVGNFDVTLFNGDDYDYWIRASRVAKISRLSGVGALYRIVPGSVSRKPRETNFELEVIRKAVARWGLLGPDGTETDKAAFDKRLQRLIFNHAYDHLNRGDPQIAYRGFQEALRLKPFDVKLWLFLARAFGKKHAQKVSGRTFSG
jgi:hypothetical protein